MTASPFVVDLGDLPSSPAVSIIICNHNHGRFVEQALRSALAQTHPCQVIVVDDGSTDDSRAVLERWRSKVRVLLKPNEGQRSAYNLGFEQSRGDLVLFLDADDTLSSDAVKNVVAAFAPRVSRVHFRLQIIDEEGETSGGKIPRHLAAGNLSHRLASAGELPPSSPGSGNAYRRTALQRLMPLPLSPVDRHAADFFTIYGTSLLGNVVALDEVLGQYRVVAASREATHLNMIFGNAAQQYLRIMETRSREFRLWVEERTGGAIRLPRKLLDFGELKGHFANKVFNRKYFEGVRAGSGELPDLLRSVYYRTEFSHFEKACLTGWALTVLVAPRSLGRPIARFVVDPASRASGS